MTEPKFTTEAEWCRAWEDLGIPDLLDVARYGDHLANRVRCRVCDDGIVRRIADEPDEPVEACDTPEALEAAFQAQQDAFAEYLAKSVALELSADPSLDAEIREMVREFLEGQADDE